MKMWSMITRTSRLLFCRTPYAGISIKLKDGDTDGAKGSRTTITSHAKIYSISLMHSLTVLLLVLPWALSFASFRLYTEPSSTARKRADFLMPSSHLFLSNISQLFVSLQIFVVGLFLGAALRKMKS